jgi:hypothetical protein
MDTATVTAHRDHHVGHEVTEQITIIIVAVVG